ncbi:helix-turn-helix transcriptional regulator [Candidatus Peregrinibacteria bacterium]|nr:helix-turn-helix transcriptional regulator [Candidatus Peregrinibacteria bacterium]
MKESIQQQFGQQVRTLRSRNELTQEKLAQQSGVSLKYIQRIEGKKPPNTGLETSQKLARGFGIPLWELFRFEKKPLKNKNQ